MNSPPEQQSFILIRRLADGRIEWVPLEAPPQLVPAAPDTAFTLIDRASYEAPQTLVAERLGEDLVVKVRGTEVLVLNGFFAATDVTFYPTTNIGSGAGPFSGSPLTPESAVPGTTVAGGQVASSAANDDGEGTGSGEEETGSGGQAGGGSSPLLWVGLGVGGLGLALLAGGGGGSGGGESGGSVPPPVSDTVPPTITSAGTAAAIAENSGPSQHVYTVTATDTGAITYSLKAGGDAAAFSIDATTGAVILTGNPDFEAKPSYSFTVVATDAAGNSSERAVSLAINDLSDTGSLTITSGATATPINENSGAQQVVYTAAATGTGVVTYSLKPGGDAAAFGINASTGAVTLTANPDDEAKGSYSFTVVARDAAGNRGELVVSLGINDLDEVAPKITSSAAANAITENSGSNQIVYTVTSTDTDDISTGSTTYSLKPVNDSALFTISSTTGAVRLTANPDFETKPNYTFTVVATDAASHSSELGVSLAVTNLVDETPPTVSSIALSSAGGVLNAGDVVTATVTMSEPTVVDTSGGTPSLELRIGNDRADAGYVSGSGTTSLIFQYTIQPGEEDTNGISIPPNALDRNDSSIADVAGNAANLGHTQVGDNPSFVVDTTAPTLSSSTPADGGSNVPLAANIVLDFSENVRAGSGNIIISSSPGGLDTRTIAITDASQVSISGDHVTINPTLNLVFNTTYSVRIDSGALTDTAGNAYAGISNTDTLNFETTPDIFGSSGSAAVSTDVNRTFQSLASEEIEVRAVGNDAMSGTAGEAEIWSGAANLGSDDRVALVGNGVDFRDPEAPANQLSLTEAAVAWQASAGADVEHLQVSLANTTVPDAPIFDGGGHTNIIPFVNLPLTTQGLV